MKNLVLGLLLGVIGTSYAVVQSADGSIMLNRDEVRQVEMNWYQLNQNFNLCVAQVGELRAQLESLQKSKCS